MKMAKYICRICKVKWFYTYKRVVKHEKKCMLNSVSIELPEEYKPLKSLRDY